MSENSRKPLVSDDGKNTATIVCSFCPSVILRPKSAKYVVKENGLSIPQMMTTKKGEETKFESESVKDFWLVSDMYDFENVGFCNTVDSWKYLACADCEIGPIGAHKIQSKEFLLSVERTMQKTTD